jgi:hypothetical protein
MEQDSYIWLYFKLNKVTSHHMMEETVLRLARLDAPQRVLGE